MKRLMPNQRGSVLIAIMLMLPFIILIAASYTELTLSGLAVAKRDQSRTHAQLATDAGVDAAMEQITLDNTWKGSTGGSIDPLVGHIQVHNANNIKTTYQTTVSDLDPTHKSVVSVGRAYRPATASKPESTVTVNVKLRKIQGGSFSVVSGVGGLFMQNSAKILGGDVFINGELNMTNSAQIGLTTNPLNVNVAHQTCPSPATATYPTVCGSGENGQPISITNPAHIYGTVKANNQTNGSGMTNPGLTASPSIAPQALPTHDRAQQKLNITPPPAPLTSSDPYYTTCNATNTTRTWPARLKIVGDVVIAKTCNIVLEGDVWITGNLTIQNSGSITTANTITLGGQNTVDPARPTVMVDGASGVLVQNSGSLLSNTSGVGMQVITYWSRASCSPDCSNVTGVDLYNSRNDKTILLQNSAEAPNTILYARWTQSELANGGSIGAVVGQTVKLSNSATITFGVAAGGLGTSYWVIENYRRAYQ